MMNDIAQKLSEVLAKKKEGLIYNKLQQAKHLAFTENRDELYEFISVTLNLWGSAQYDGSLKELAEHIQDPKFEIILQDTLDELRPDELSVVTTGNSMKFTFNKDISKFKLIIKEKVLEV